MRALLVALSVLVPCACFWLADGQLLAPWVGLSAATLAAAGTPLGVAVGVLALLSSTLEIASPVATAWTAGAWVAGGLALGLLLREIDRDLPWALTGGATRTGVAGSALVAVAALLPHGRLVLLDASGAPLWLAAQIQDPAAGLAGRVNLPAVLASPPPGELMLILALLLAVASAFALLRQEIEGDHEVATWGWPVMGTAGVLLALAGAWGLMELLGGSVSVPDGQAWALALSKAGQGTAVTGIETPTAATLGLASRPLVDPIRLMVGLAVSAWVWGPWRHRPVARVYGPRPLILLAVAAAVLAATLGLGSMTWAILAGALLAFASVLVAQTRPASSRLGIELVVLATATWLSAWLTPAWTGALG
jgi:hypothetical protein